MSKVKIQTRYGTTPNDLLNNPDISLKAKGLFAYIQSKPDDWSFSVERIANQVKDGIASVRTAIKELENAGYLERIPAKKEDGTWDGYDYILYPTPTSNKPLFEQPSAENLLAENIATISKKDISKQDIVNKNKDIYTLFDEFWKEYPRKTAKKKAKERFVKIFSGKNPPELKTLLEALENHKRSKQWSQDKIIPHASTWLNQERWEDEMDTGGIFFNTKQASKKIIDTIKKRL